MATFTSAQLYGTGSIIADEMTSDTTFQYNGTSLSHVHITFDVIGGDSTAVPLGRDTGWALGDANGVKLHTAFSTTNWAWSFPKGTHDSGEFTIASSLPTIPANTMRVRAVGLDPSSTVEIVTVGGGGSSLPVTDDLWGHFDAALGVTKDGSDLVSDWLDQSGNGNHFAQVTGLDQPLFIADVGAELNNKPAIGFDGGSQLGGKYFTQPRSIYDGGDAIGYDYTLLAVFTDFVNDGTSQWGRFFWTTFDRDGAGLPGNPTISNAGAFKSATGNIDFWASSVTNTWNMKMQAGSVPACFNSVGAGSPHILIITADTVTPAWGPSVLDGAAIAALGAAFSGGGGGTSPQTLLNRGDTFGTSPLGGFTYKLSELIIYNAALSTADRGTMDTYLNDKYLVY